MNMLIFNVAYRISQAIFGLVQQEKEFTVKMEIPFSNLP